MKQCPYCGVDLEDTAVACRWCATDLKPTANVVKTKTPSQHASGIGWWLIAIVLSGLLFGTCVWMAGRIH
jgi:hypothetical protein